MQFRGCKITTQRASCVLAHASPWFQGSRKPLTAPPQAASPPANTQTCCWWGCQPWVSGYCVLWLVRDLAQAKYSSTCWFVGFWALFPWGLCPCSAHRSFQEAPGITYAALCSLLLLQSTIFLGMDGHQWQTKRWREENATFRPLEGLFQVLGLWWGRVHIAAVILAVLWGITYNSVWHCRRLWTGSRYLELSCGAAVFSLCSLPQANALEKLELKIIQPFLEAKQRKIGNLFFPPLYFPF